MSAKSETVFRNRFKAFLKTLPGTHFFPIQQQAICGTPDFLVCVRGRFVAIELKSRAGKLSELQKYNLNQVLDCGGVALVVFPKDFEVVKYTLQEMSK